MIKVRAHTCYLGHTGFAAHARNFFRELSKYTDLRVRNYTWDSNPVFNSIDYSVLDLITLTNSDGSESDYHISQSFPGSTWKSHTDFNQDVDIVLMDMHHKYFYDAYEAPIKIAYTVWESTELESGFFNQLMKFDYLWVVTEWHKDMAIKQGYPGERIFIVNEGVDSIFFTRKEAVNDTFKFMFFGRWDYRKAVPEIIQTFLKAFPDNDGIELLLSADNPYSVDGFNSTEERLEHYKISDPRINILHFPSREEYVDHIKSGNVLITCARSEGWNIPLIEAMAAGTPVIYSNWGAQLEFAKGFGNPVKIDRELPANIGRDLGFAGDTPGLYAEPDYNDLERVLLDCYHNYDIKKKKALNEAKIIQDRFNWKKIGLDGFDILKKINTMNSNFEITKIDAVVVMSHADDDDKLNLLEKCILANKRNGYTVILSSHIDVPQHISNLADYIIIDRDNPIITHEESRGYTEDVIFSFWNFEDFDITQEFKFNHSYAALKLIKNAGILAELNGFEKVHFVNYDYIINDNTLENNALLLDNNDFISYNWSTYNDKLAVNTGFFSVNVSIFNNVVKDLNSKRNYFKYPGSVTLENVIGSAILENNIKYHIIDIDSIKDDNIINAVAINTRWIYSSGCMLAENNNNYYIVFMQNDNKTYNLKIDNKKYTITANTECKFIKVDRSDLMKGVNVNSDIFTINDVYASINIKKPGALDDIEFINRKTDRIIINYLDGPYVEILGDSDYLYNVKFIDTKTSKTLYSCEISPNHWTKCSIRYFIKWKIEIENLSTGEIITDNFSPENKLVEVMIDSASLGDTIAWMPHVNEFAEINNCRVILKTFKNFLFDIEKYPRISFDGSFDEDQPSGSDSMNPLPKNKETPYAHYKIGWFYNYQSFNNNLNPRDFKTIPLQATTSDILGIEYRPIKPIIKINDIARPISSKYICIGVHSTAQAKYWNNPTGWQDIVDHYKLNGYEVVIVSSEGDGYMGNKNPEGAIYMKDNSMDTLMSYLYNCDMFIGISSGISWLSWALNKKTVIISGFSKPFTEPLDDNIIRIFNKSVCNGCFNTYKLDAGDWNWCPINKGTDKQFECSKSITGESVISIIESGKSPQYENADEIEYVPVNRDFPNTADQPMQSAWGNIPTILKDIIDRFGVDTSNALEFGVEYGYSASAIANYFTNVLGVDIFTGDIHSGIKDDHMEQTKNYLKPYNNITLLKSDYRDFIKNNHDIYGLIHIDIIHDFEHTYECGAWAVQHSRVTIFHDTESFFEVKRACQELADNFDLEFYNYKESHGLGILVNRKIK
jgi:autotransporter strand-loop-strand O-heptosyltransferase